MCRFEREVIGFCDFFREYNQQASLKMTLPWLQLTTGLIGDTAAFSGPNGSFNLEENQRGNEGSDADPLQYMYELETYYARIVLLYTMGAVEKADDDRKKILQLKGEAATNYLKFCNIFFSGLTCLAMAQKGRRMWYYNRQANSYRKQLKRCAETGSVNCVPMLALYTAEIAALKDRKGNAIRNYNEAISMSGRSGFRLFKAISCERAGEYLLACGNNETGCDYLRQAFEEFGDFGATAKKAQMKQKYREFTSFSAREEVSSRASLKLQPHMVREWRQEVSTLSM